MKAITLPPHIKTPILVLVARCINKGRLIQNTRERLYTEAPFFIIGSGRNGSTLLACILNNHPNLFIPPEQTAIPRALIKWSIQKTPWDKFIQHFITNLSSHSNQWQLDFDDIQRSLLSLEYRHRNFANIVSLIYKDYGHLLSKSNFLWGDKTPSNTHYVRLLKQEFPNSKYIFLVRDPRDVILSHLTANPVYYANLLDFLIWRWKDSVYQFEWLNSNFQDDVFLLPYERFVISAAQETQRIIDWLGPHFALLIGVSEYEHLPERDQLAAARPMSS